DRRTVVDDRSALPDIAGALRRSLLGPTDRGPSVRSGGSRVRSPPLPSRLAPAAGSLLRRARGTRPVHSPVRDVPASLAVAHRGVKGVAQPGQSAAWARAW